MSVIYCFTNLLYCETISVLTSKSVPEGMLAPGGPLHSSQYLHF